MVDGQDKLVQGGGEGRDEDFENVWEVASPLPPWVGEFDS